ncbi:tRNA (guanosine(37)-N1)-methyltransferase TrmD [Candidatus Daviesbacteria bacterium RIFCSPLOWO2_02_FULL_40_8]|uniref:tRNA (guanine-N(1)-)-methyltransferase n=1 Tax=Candidatus Daviesbacteria bacterium RIFCSPLOWO2_01_FULL_40_24 TaxID=1797787 RepID=A0A1F5MIV1_9BACT|nr:MAG: tRNA (guanosine(37)-N1)-methyltransferase TrmD [Candidatus Daviesbacteria bacterium RIFCSPHIGHO2_01_FULL_41_45]OGE35545.1 MAG: tRNA (guanosine(37)-N1)-methyltransferase TrmD [Candidatus Daviesbacteria bacterium RIFCSPHIGHO2_02_FULL_41_14]OGE65294.1 MAG: tRNA (guanosine(37)-N1)-methyltransferase TrmD [Candidatus Daviesbacteria bacterium RIFCSPLOWO2_01_FULL_40_24]OGE66942.1 MAG: tRNA (guanosine(37)-N1)-methyltransferase TrmD [Candidatus Daviesbacteria bacterium RIFCSPLOWO2_02_FULL_40_8]
MKITILTLFPEMFPPILNLSILGRGQKKGLVEFNVLNIRDFATDKHKTVDDSPYGGGIGLVFKADVLVSAIKSVGKGCVVLTSASGTPFKQSTAQELSQLDHLILVCGHYEGVDQRFIDKYVNCELSIGDYVLTGGEIPAMAIADAVTRLIPGVLEKPEAVAKESFVNNLLEHPQYTRPEEFEGDRVPAILLSGNHQEVEKWRSEESLKKTKQVRPDLLKSLKRI